MELSITARVICFVALSLVFLRISWKPLHNPKSHGFYRFFVFEGILLLLMLNVNFWFENPFSMIHIISWILLAASVAVVLHGLCFLKRKGGQGKREVQAENFSFENTVNLVQSGIYRYIRHPMYASLLYLSWGIFFKHPSLIGVFTVALTSFFLYLTAKIEEHENIAFFGPAYEDYMLQTRMFIPFIV
jgi:protein-S-isoprenylcysteine O-methyltransferase Ste14